jgi:hypothetical protein
VRFADVVYLLGRGSTNLPTPVIVVTSVMILYGAFLGVKKFTSVIRMKELLTFYMVQTGMILLNLIYTAVATPLQINALETIVVGTFLDLLINAGLITWVLRQMRAMYEPSVHSMAAGGR